MAVDASANRASSSSNSTRNTSRDHADRGLDGVYGPYRIASWIGRLPAPFDFRLRGRIASALRCVGDKATPLVNAHSLDCVRELAGGVSDVFMAGCRSSAKSGRVKVAGNRIVGSPTKETRCEGWLVEHIRRLIWHNSGDYRPPIRKSPDAAKALAAVLGEQGVVDVDGMLLRPLAVPGCVVACAARREG